MGHAAAHVAAIDFGIRRLEILVRDGTDLVAKAEDFVGHVRAALEELQIEKDDEQAGPPPIAPAIPRARSTGTHKAASQVNRSTDPHVSITGPQRQLLQALAWWAAMGHHQPSRPQVAGIAGWKITSGHLKNVVGSLRTAGLVEYPADGRIAMTDAGRAAAPEPDLSVTLIDGVRSVLSGPQKQIFDTLLTAGADMTREEIAAACGWEPTSGHLKNVIGSLRTLEIVDYPSGGRVSLQDWVRS
jgi:hypothetical protein